MTKQAFTSNSVSPAQDNAS